MFLNRSDRFVRLKIENSNDPTQSVETDSFTTLSGEWETEFDFSNHVDGTQEQIQISFLIRHQFFSILVIQEIKTQYFILIMFILDLL